METSEKTDRMVEKKGFKKILNEWKWLKIDGNKNR